MTDPTAAELAAWREACDKATPGDWEVSVSGWTDENWRFVCVARTALPLLLDHAAGLKAEVERVVKAWKEFNVGVPLYHDPECHCISPDRVDDRCTCGKWEAENKKDRAYETLCELMAALAGHDQPLEVDRLLSLLREYGRHAEGCSAAHGDQYRCRCGWRDVSAALAGRTT